METLSRVMGLPVGFLDDEAANALQPVLNGQVSHR